MTLSNILNTIHSTTHHFLYTHPPTLANNTQHIIIITRNTIITHLNIITHTALAFCLAFALAPPAERTVAQEVGCPRVNL